MDISTSCANLRILLAEDNSANRLVAKSLLEQSGHSVIAVADGSDALKQLRNNIFDLVLLDVMMPVLDGLRTLRRIRRYHPDRKSMPIFALTAYTGIQDSQRYRLAGFDAVVSKPLTQGDIETAWNNYHAPETLPVISPGSETVPKHPALLDMDMIEQIKSATDTERRAAILADYWKSAEELCQTLKLCLPDAIKGEPRALTQFRTTVHTLKGASLSVGAYRIAETARVLRNAPPGKIAELLHDLIKALLDSRSCLSEAYSDSHLALGTR